MDYIGGKRVYPEDIFTPNGTRRGRLTNVGEQLVKLMQQNRRLISEHGRKLDLVGLEGFVNIV
ncbi:MAG: hypothetical protein KGJ07_00895 [Patescibacteria group bacterium]|nr:hypothetical protein [Patescibacteria group bacterium]MDE2588576.1 hypothetical protein [Patescibacteria group bacterium]